MEDELNEEEWVVNISLRGGLFLNSANQLLIIFRLGSYEASPRYESI